MYTYINIYKLYVYVCIYIYIYIHIYIIYIYIYIYIKFFIFINHISYCLLYHLSCFNEYQKFADDFSVNSYLLQYLLASESRRP